MDIFHLDTLVSGFFYCSSAFSFLELKQTVQISILAPFLKNIFIQTNTPENAYTWPAWAGVHRKKSVVCVVMEEKSDD